MNTYNVLQPRLTGSPCTYRFCRVSAWENHLLSKTNQKQKKETIWLDINIFSLRILNTIIVMDVLLSNYFSFKLLIYLYAIEKTRSTKSDYFQYLRSTLKYWDKRF